MHILMISLDRGLLGRGQLGDVIERHKIYGEAVASLDIIVFSRAGFCENKISENVTAIPTNSKNKLGYYFDSLKLGCQICQSKKIDLIVTHEPFITGLVGYKLGKKYNAKVLMHLHGDYLFNNYWLKEQKIYYLLLMPLARYLVRRADALRVMSEGIKEKVQKLGVPAEIIQVINTPVDVEKFEHPDPQKVQAIKNKYQGKKIILFVGRLEKVKDIPTLIMAFASANAKYNDAVLLIAGEGKLKKKLQATSYKPKDDPPRAVYFIGQISHADLINYYHACSFIALSSFSESFGKIVLEAAAAKKPTVATEVTGTKDTIKNGETGFLVPVGDSEKLAEKMLALLQSDELQNRLGEHAYEFIKEKFNWKKNLKTVTDYWQEIISKK